MPVAFLRNVFAEHAAETAIVHRDEPTTYGELLAAIVAARTRLAAAGIAPGAVVALEADFAPASIALLIALIEGGAITVPLAPTTGTRKPELREISGATWQVVVDEAGDTRIAPLPAVAQPPLLERLRDVGHPGLILFTSGATGQPKASLHDWVRLLHKYRRRRPPHRTLLFLLFDHIGGIDTLLQALSSGSPVVIPADRSPRTVAETIARHRVEVLPAAPSFLNLMLLGEAHAGLDLTSLRYITYGAEVMPQGTLEKLARVFPGVTLLQKYGITEVGTLRSRSRANDSLWVRIGGEGFQTRVVDGLLQIKAESSIVGYLNAPSPFTDDGWFMTGDAVEVDGDEFRILGRASDLINVGGRKVYPSEVESVVLDLEGIVEVAVFGEPNPFTGQVVVARVTALGDEDPRALEQRVRAHCLARLEPYKVPARVEVSAEPLHSARHKITRR